MDGCEGWERTTDASGWAGRADAMASRVAEGSEEVVMLLQYGSRW